MADVPVELVVAAFTDEQAASRVLEELKAAKQEKLIGIRDAAVIQRGTDDKVHIRETGDMRGGKGAVIGGIVGAAIGLVLPPAVLVTGAAGAAIGGLAARLRDSGFPDARLRAIGDALKPGTSALVAVIEHTWVAELEDELARQGAQLVTEEITTDIAEQLEAGHGVSSSALLDDEGVTVERSVRPGEQEPSGASARPPESSAEGPAPTPAP
jgi:uncharacterized membrane protein